MATLKKTADGKIDKRTKEYKELVERAKKARRAKARATKASTTTTKPASKTTTAKTPAKTTTAKTTATKTTTAKTTSTTKTATSSVKRRADGKIDLRTKEGREMAEKMAKARAARSKDTPTKGITALIKKLLK